MVFIAALLVLLSHPLLVTTNDRAGNRMEAFSAVDGPDPLVQMSCTEDGGLCARIDATEAGEPRQLNLFAGRDQAEAMATYEIPDRDGSTSFAIWPAIVRYADPEGAILLGVEARTSVMYSGGGGEMRRLMLLRLTPSDTHEQAVPVLEAPLFGSLIIRACFSEMDFKNRAGACHDEYGFNARLTLDPTTLEGPPRLIFKTEATSYPGPVARDVDSLAKPPLTAADLKTVQDTACSYRRVFSWDSAAAAYRPDRPLPECDAYTEP